MATILIVEDNPSLVEAWSEVLKLSGHVVQSVRSGIDALNLINAGADTPEVILCDQRLRDITGLEVLRHVRGAEHLTDVFVIITSGDMDLEEEAIKAGADSFLAKPFPIMRLLQLVERRHN